MEIIEWIKEYKMFVICILFALLFTYGKYFIDTTEIAKLSSTISAYMWIMLGVLFVIHKEIKELKAQKTTTPTESGLNSDYKKLPSATIP